MGVSTPTSYLCRDCGQPLPWDGMHTCSPQAGMRARALLLLDTAEKLRSTTGIAQALGVTTGEAYDLLTALEGEGMVDKQEGEADGARGRPPARWRLSR